MLAIINSCTIIGIEGFLVKVEVDVSNGMPAFDIVGLPDAAVREAKERVKAAIRNSGYQFPDTRITVNLAPASIKKEGPIFDLPIAMGILAATGQSRLEKLQKCMVLGELSLNGSVRSARGILPATLAAKQHHLKKILVPAPNADEATIVKAVEVLPIQNLRQLVKWTKDECPINAAAFKGLNAANAPMYPDFAHIKGQAHVKRALEVAAAGAHNVLMVGPPGTGKTLLARSVPSILPALSLKEALEITQIHSVSNTNLGVVRQRPFRAPHHSISFAGLIGGGRVPRPGEVSLAHLGVLFLDELPEFSSKTLEQLRQPIEDGFVTITRSQITCTFPTRFMLIAAMNPCPCGYYGDTERPCQCSPYQIQRYRNKISGPLLDRIDVHIQVPRITYEELTAQEAPTSSSIIQKRVEAARERQKTRLKQFNIYTNSDMGHAQVTQFCKLKPETEYLFRTAYKKLKLSARAYDRILKVARTIADLNNSEQITTAHLAEAIQYRQLNI